MYTQTHSHTRADTHTRHAQTQHTTWGINVIIKEGRCLSAGKIFVTQAWELDFKSPEPTWIWCGCGRCPWPRGSHSQMKSVEQLARHTWQTKRDCCKQVWSWGLTTNLSSGLYTQHVEGTHSTHIHKHTYAQKTYTNQTRHLFIRLTKVIIFIILWIRLIFKEQRKCLYKRFIEHSFTYWIYILYSIERWKLR